MKTKLLTAAILLLSVVAANAAGPGNMNGAGDTRSTTSSLNSSSSGKEDNLGYLSGPRWKHPMVRTNNRPFWHGMSSRRSHHHWWEFWE